VVIMKELVVPGKTIEPGTRAKTVTVSMRRRSVESTSGESTHLMTGHGSRRDRQ